MLALSHAGLGERGRGCLRKCGSDPRAGCSVSAASLAPGFTAGTQYSPVAWMDKEGRDERVDDGQRPCPLIPHSSRDQAGVFQVHAESQAPEMVWPARPRLLLFHLGSPTGRLCWLWGRVSVADTQHLQRLGCVSGFPPSEIHCLL